MGSVAEVPEQHFAEQREPSLQLSLGKCIQGGFVEIGGGCECVVEEPLDRVM